MSNVLLVGLVLLGGACSAMADFEQASALGVSVTLAEQIDKSVSDQSASTTEGSPLEVDYRAPYPYPAAHLWQILLKVIELPEGKFDISHLEQIFGVPFRLDDTHQVKKYLLIRNESWYFNVFFANNNDTGYKQFFFSWGNEFGKRSSVFPEPPIGMCLEVKTLDSDVLQKGWRFDEEQEYQYGVPNKRSYLKGKNILELDFFTRDNCLRSFGIKRTPH